MDRKSTIAIVSSVVGAIAIILVVVAIVFTVKRNALQATAPQQSVGLVDIDQEERRPLNELVGNKFGKVEAGAAGQDFLSVDPETGQYRHDILKAFPSIGNTKGGPSRVAVEGKMIVPNVFRLKFAKPFTTTAESELQEHLPQSTGERKTIDEQQKSRGVIRLYHPVTQHNFDPNHIADRTLFAMRPDKSVVSTNN
jgi:hypothetical protein